MRCLCPETDRSTKECGQLCQVLFVSLLGRWSFMGNLMVVNVKYVSDCSMARIFWIGIFIVNSSTPSDELFPSAEIS